ncbi:MAG: TIGR04149 family rSAM-modified RiPP [Prevotellaceae bacterium]|jgi:natural product precursor|nr:TIGR04149 family rSAM-modified RiPP [Prevotellaceae bacterium]
MKKINLNVLAKNAMKKKEMNLVKGGIYKKKDPCACLRNEENARGNANLGIQM